jgi:molybdopterin-guanine dinucleotide biosynthesis protein A
MTTRCNVNAAVVLCGGRSRRLGRDKCGIALGHRTLLGHVLAAVHESLETVCLVGRARQDPHELIPAEYRANTSFVSDAVPDYGPLEGMRAGLESLPPKTQLVLLVGCDNPLITPRWIEFVLHCADGYQAAIPWIDGRLMPIPAVYSRSVIGPLQQALARGERSLWRFAERLNTRQLRREELEVVDPGLQCLINVNDDSTLETVMDIWAQRTTSMGPTPGPS